VSHDWSATGGCRIEGCKIPDTGVETVNGISDGTAYMPVAVGGI
jgi:hypothetical protein